MFKETIAPELLLLIEKISEITEIIEQFYLAGGTGLALQIGHRKSVDLDLFNQNRFNLEIYSQVILKLNGKIIKEEEGTIIAELMKVKMSLFYYPYPLIEDFYKIKKLNVAGIKDIACMKVIAIAQRGEKKDFYDLYEILKMLELPILKQLLLKKYGSNKINFYHVLKSLVYFDDVEDSFDPVILNQTDWIDVKDYFIQNEEKFRKVFLS